MLETLLGLQDTNDHIKHEYGIFNADKEKICAASHADPNDPEWSFLWDKPIGYTYLESEAIKRVENENARRAKLGELETHGPVMYKRRQIVVGPWEP